KSPAGSPSNNLGRTVSDIWSLAGIAPATLELCEGMKGFSSAMLGGHHVKTSSTQKMSRKTLRFTPADIVRAIDGFEAAGVQVCGVEITPTGIIKMTGGPTSISQLRKQPPTP